MMITLTGFMGSGKTTVGKVLADFLGCPFMDLDDLVVKKAGKSISRSIPSSSCMPTPKSARTCAST